MKRRLPSPGVLLILYIIYALLLILFSGCDNSIKMNNGAVYIKDAKPNILMIDLDPQNSDKAILNDVKQALNIRRELLAYDRGRKYE